MLGTCEKFEAANRAADGRGGSREWIGIHIFRENTEWKDFFHACACDDVITHFASIT